MTLHKLCSTDHIGGADEQFSGWHGILDAGCRVDARLTTKDDARSTFLTAQRLQHHAGLEATFGKDFSVKSTPHNEAEHHCTLQKQVQQVELFGFITFGTDASRTNNVSKDVCLIALALASVSRYEAIASA